MPNEAKSTLDGRVTRSYTSPHLFKRISSIARKRLRTRRARPSHFLTKRTHALGAPVQGFAFKVRSFPASAKSAYALTPSLPSDGRGSRRWIAREITKRSQPRGKERAKGAGEKGGKGAIHLHPTILPNEPMRLARRFKVSRSKFEVFQPLRNRRMPPSLPSPIRWARVSLVDRERNYQTKPTSMNRRHQALRFQIVSGTAVIHAAVQIVQKIRPNPGKSDQIRPKVFLNRNNG